MIFYRHVHVVLIQQHVQMIDSEFLNIHNIFNDLVLYIYYIYTCNIENLNFDLNQFGIFDYSKRIIFSSLNLACNFKYISVKYFLSFNLEINDDPLYGLIILISMY